MDYNQFVKDLSVCFQNPVIDNEKSYSFSPRTPVTSVYGIVGGYGITFGFSASKEVKIIVNKKPPHYMYVSPSNLLTKFSDALKISGAVKSDDFEFDTTYSVRNTGKQAAKKTLVSENITLIKKLDPFAYFEMTHKIYKFVKDVNNNYTVRNAEDDLNNLAKFVKNCDSIWNLDKTNIRRT
jgi:hypothetical protein